MGLAEPDTTPPGSAAPADRSLAQRWISDLVYSRLLELDHPASGRELLPFVNGYGSVGPKALKTAILSDPRIRMEERRWTLHPDEIDPKRPLERSIVSLIETAGLPLTPDALANALAPHYGREESAMAGLVERMIKGRRDFFLINDQLIGLSAWLLDPSAGNEDDVEFENFEDTSEIDALRPFADQVNWSEVPLAEGAARFLDLADRPVTTKTLQFFQWRAKPGKFDPAHQYRSLLERPDVRLLSPGEWVGPKQVAGFRITLDEIEDTSDVELTNEDVPKPITVEPEDLDAISGKLGEQPSRMLDLLRIRFPELRADDPNFNTTLSSLDKALRTDDRFMWTGWDRWAAPQPVPDSARQYPQAMEPIVVDVELAAGQLEDIELEDEGLEGNLAEEIERPLVKYGASVVRQEDGVLRCVVTYGPRQAGVLPVGDDASGFPRQPDFLLITTKDEADEERAHWVNNDLKLMYNLGEWYTSVDLPASGAMFTLEPLDGPGNYLIAYNGGSEEDAYLDDSRVKDLLAIRNRTVVQMTSTREIIQDLLGHYSKGISFTRLYSEVVVVRMTSARMVASILSGYYEFYNKGDLWLFNARDAAKGFKKQKKKYLRKR